MISFRESLHGVGSIWKRTRMFTFKRCLYKGPAGNVANGTPNHNHMVHLMKSMPFRTIPRKKELV